jgi:histidyl-tRNA synthetase
MNKAPQTLKGFRDFLPKEKRQRDFVARKIKRAFELFGFEPLETPTLEYADLLLGKYGNEADKLVYVFEDKGGRNVGLRYDQTVPTARVLAQYRNELPKFFRRYQMQTVFRADKPQKGRFREFAQCDIDIFGTKSEIADAEILACTYFAYKNIGFSNIKILVNSREVLFNTLNQFATDSVNTSSIIQTIDKLDKLSEEDVVRELKNKGLSLEASENVLLAIKDAKPNENLEKIFSLLIEYGLPEDAYEFTPSIARGLDYYTGMIFEVRIPDYSGGSLGGGGRYDNLINELSGVDVPAVGMAFGFDRTVEAAIDLGLVKNFDDLTRVLITLFDESSVSDSLDTAAYLRNENISTELYPEVDKIGKQIKYADKKGIPFVVIIGEEELKQNKVTLKEMASGESKLVTLEELVLSL